MGHRDDRHWEDQQQPGRSLEGLAEARVLAGRANRIEDCRWEGQQQLGLSLVGPTGDAALAERAGRRWNFQC